MKWKNRAAIVEICRRFGYNYDTQEPTELPQIDASAIAGDSGLLDIRAIDAVDGNVSERELVTICRVVKSAHPMSVFELGTFDGRTTLNLAANSPVGATVHTLDLPRQSIGSSAAPIHAHEVRYADKDVSGSRYKGSDVESKIVQHYGDSDTWDFTPYYGKVDLVFVDASHAYDYVINDSLHAIHMLRGSEGAILWHDYSRWDGVTRALNELRRLDSRFAGLKWISGTTLAYLTR